MIQFLLSHCPFPLPSLYQWFLFLPLGIVIGSFSGYGVGYCKERYQLPVGYSRKMFHFIIFTCAGIVGISGGFAAVQVYGTAVGLVVGYAVIKGRASSLFRAVARPGDAPYERFYILVPFLMTALGGMTSNILFGSFALIGYITTGWGDAVGEPVGTRWGKHRYRVPTLTGIKAYRSLEGSAAVFMASLIGCCMFLCFGFEYSISTIVISSLIIALTSTLVEAFTLHSMDNLTIQVASAGMAYWMLNHG